jgi:broad specificity phosphatase PhoE
MPTVHLVRHGHVHNPQKVLYGRLASFGLSDTGRAMADAVAAHLVAHEVPVARVVASPLQRAQETAVPIAAAFSLPIDTDERLVEAWNVWEGAPLQSGAKDFIHPRNWWRLRNPWRPSWGEPYTEQAERMWQAIHAAAAATPHGDTVMVSHQLPIWVARSTQEKRSLFHDPRSRECALGSITSFHIDADSTVTGVTYASPAGHIEVPA